jgi:N4-gp56 family major capsid protein
MTRMAKGQKAVQRERLSDKVAELQASSGATTTGTTSPVGSGDSLSEYTAIEFLERVVRDAEERRVFEQVASVYDDLVDVGDSTLEIPRTTGHLDLTDQGSEGSDRGYQQLENLDTVETTITASSFVSGGVKISKQAMMTTNIDLVEEARNAVTQQMAEDVDYAIRDEIVSSTPSPSHVIDQTSSGELTPESIADAMEKIEQDNYTPRFLIVAPTHINDLRKDSQFTNAAEYGDDEVIMDGEIGQYLGVSVLKTQAAVRSGPGDTYAYMVGEGPEGQAVGPAIVYKELPSMDMEFDREENTQKIYYDHTFETNTIQDDALALIQTA